MSPAAEKEGFKKIQMTCTIARAEHDLDYAWIDTSCIDKSSSAELSEAINSMFKWYQQANVCFAFLADLQVMSENLAGCSCFSRAWTLQELIAPERMQFFDQTWAYRGDKHTLCSEISSITGISEDVLIGRRSLMEVPIAVRMSWASLRHATREEDLTYCLLGLFDVNMPMLYGEGAKAFVRLQLDIIKESADMSLFAWSALEEGPPEYSGLLARAPADFRKSGALVVFENVGQNSTEISTTNQGIRLRYSTIYSPGTSDHIIPLPYQDLSVPLSINYLEHSNVHNSTGILLHQVGTDLFVRACPRILYTHDAFNNSVPISESVHIAKTLSDKQAASIGRRVICICKNRNCTQDILGLFWDP